MCKLFTSGQSPFTAASPLFSMLRLNIFLDMCFLKLSSKAHVASCVNTQGLHSEPILSSAPPTECNNILSDSGSNASSSSRNWGSGLDGQPRPGDEAAPSPWLELELRDRSTITGTRFEVVGNPKGTV